MNRNRLSAIVRCVAGVASFLAFAGSPAAAQTEIVLHTTGVSRTLGDWQQVADSTAASGVRMWNPDRGAAKLSSAMVNPYDYFELTFTAEAGRPYRLWVRGKADDDHYGNDSVFVQFNGSLDSAGAARYRVGTTDAAIVSIEACSGCGLYRWGWEDNGWASLGPVIYFATTGPQMLRIQRREDGVSIDQVVLSASKYYSSPPGATKNDSTIVAATSGSASSSTSSTTTTSTAPSSTTASGAEIVITSANATKLAGTWGAISDSTAAGGTAIGNPDQGAGKITTPLASPSNYAEFTFSAEAGRSYRLWIRGKADANHWANDSVFVQFNGSLTTSGSATARIGTTSALTVNLEDAGGAGLSGWGWQDNGYGTDVLGPLVMFASTGTQTMRIQTREDGLRIDQIVLSASKYVNGAPGALKNDTTILAGGSTTTTTTTSTTTTTTSSSSTSTSTSGTVTLRVLQWNLHHGAGTDGVYNIERIANWMVAMKPDVILLNEVEKNTWWGYEDQPARYKAMLEQKTGKRWYSHFSQEYGQWSSNGKGHQILSTYPFDSVGHTTITLSSGLNWGGVVSQAAITVNGRTINLFVTHLDPYDQAMRLIQAQDVIRWASGFAENRILAGDMNAWPDQSSILEYYKYYRDSWVDALNSGRAYAPADISPYGATKKGRIDYIMHSKGATNLVAVESQVYDTRDSSGVMPSDHRPVLTTFQVR